MLVGVGTFVYTLVSANAGESKYGTMAMPGATRAELPAGHVDVTFTADFSGQTVPVPVLQPGDVIVSPVDGGASATFSQYIGAVNSDNDVIHVQVGTLSVPRAGAYRIAVDDESDLPAPQLHFGQRTDNGPVLAGGLGLAGFLAVTGVGMFTAIGTRRSKFVPAVGSATPGPVVLGDPNRPLPGHSRGGLTPEESAQAALDGGFRLGLVRAEATVLAAHDVAIPPGLPGAPPGGLVDLTFDVSFPGGEPGYATITRVAFATPERRAQIAVVGQTWPVLVNPDVRDKIALDTSRIPPAPV
ncbi:MAG TPA: hypothetical protein VHF26_13945 [Trebonia sp.]|nr:hypothetical protein [Trebonia sp.]